MTLLGTVASSGPRVSPDRLRLHRHLPRHPRVALRGYVNECSDRASLRRPCPRQSACCARRSVSTALPGRSASTYRASPISRPPHTIHRSMAQAHRPAHRCDDRRPMRRRGWGAWPNTSWAGGCFNSSARTASVCWPLRSSPATSSDRSRASGCGCVSLVQVPSAQPSLRASGCLMPSGSVHRVVVPTACPPDRRSRSLRPSALVSPRLDKRVSLAQRVPHVSCVVALVLSYAPSRL